MNTKRQNEINNVFSQTELDISFDSEISAKLTFPAPHRYISNPANFAQKPATQCFSLRFDVDDEFSAKCDTFQVNYAFSDYHSSYSATTPRKEFSAMMPNFIHDSNSTYPIPRNDRHSLRKKIFKKIINPLFHKSPSLKNKKITKINMSAFFSAQNFGLPKVYETGLCISINKNSVIFWTKTLKTVIKSVSLILYKHTSYLWKV